MNYIVLDLEWNQPFDFRTTIKKPVFLRGEIIQIGAVKTDEDHHILSTFKIMVKPKYYTKMHSKVSRLTQITNRDLQYGFPFPTALKYFRNWCGEDFAFLTWGPDDLERLRENMALHQLETDWLPETYNLQIIFDHQITKEHRQVSLLDAVDKVGEKALTAHDALNDARNTVTVCQHLDMEKGLQEYNKLQSQLLTLGTQPVERSEPLKTYDSKEAALADPELINFFCPFCGERVTCHDFVQQNNTKTICIGQCEHGDELLVRFKFKRWPDGKYSVSRIIYEMNEENKQYYLSKKKYKEEARAMYLQRLAQGA